MQPQVFCEATIPETTLLKTVVMKHSMRNGRNWEEKLNWHSSNFSRTISHFKAFLIS